MMTIRKLREQMRMGRSIYDLPLRVTYYARVSTEKVEQQGSLENQVQYYTEFIQKNPNWTFVQGYVDEGMLYNEFADIEYNDANGDGSYMEEARNDISKRTGVDRSQIEVE